MSYNTDYTLEHNVPEADWPDAQDQFDALGVGTIFYCGQWNDISWYEHEEDLLRISTQFPEATFTLHGTGEATDDMWQKRFRAGRVEEVRPEIVWPEFEELT